MVLSQAYDRTERAYYKKSYLDIARQCQVVVYEDDPM